MRVLVINPNTTSAMTAHVAAQLRLHLPVGTVLIEKTATFGGPVIASAESFAAGAKAAAAVLSEALHEGLEFDQVLLACFGDPGLEALRQITSIPVTGLAATCMQQAENMGLPYAIVTCGSPWKSILDARLAQWNASKLYLGTHVLPTSGLEVFANPLAAMPAVLNGIKAARRAGAQHIILGGVVLAGYKALMTRSGAPVEGLLDCVEAAANALSSKENPDVMRGPSR